ncbi:MAG: hypothetical protein HYV09_13755 [Deltaproteobacteria bacterium]|nr:hypothetical protein [Deltaproteobacteria bacterium]
MRPRRTLRSPLVVALSLLAPLALSLGAARAGDLKARVTGFESLRPAALASATAADKKLFTLREFDPLVPPKYTNISAKPDKDVTLAIYGAGDKSGFGLGAVIRLAGGRAVPSTVVIPPGVAVFFRNDDPFVHHVKGPELSRDLRPGESHKLEPKGKLSEFTDDLVPSVKAWVVVEDGVIANRWPNPDGSVRITDMADAEYTIKAFFEGKAKTSVTFKVPAKGSVDLKEPIAVAPPAASGK